MPDLSKLKELVKQFEEIEGDLEKLKTEKEAIESDIITLTSKRNYLKRKIEDEGIERDTEYKLHLESVKAHKTELQGLLGEISIAQESLETVNAEVSEKKSKIEELDKAWQVQTDVHKEEIKIHQTTLAGIVAQIREQGERLEELREEKRQLKASISSLASEKAATTSEKKEAVRSLNDELSKSENLLADLGVELEERRAELLRTNKLIDVAKEELKKTMAKNEQFKVFEEKARKALSARETSLLEKEESFRIEKVTSNRRASVLDNIPE